MIVLGGTYRTKTRTHRGQLSVVEQIQTRAVRVRPLTSHGQSSKDTGRLHSIQLEQFERDFELVKVPRRKH